MRSSARRLIPLFVMLAAAVAVLGWRLAGAPDDRPVFPPDDFVEYWAAGRLNAHGENPYDPELLLPMERHAGRDTDDAVMMWNPPWTLPLVMPFGVLPPKVAHLSWVVMGFALILLAADRTWVLAGGPVSARWASWLVALTYLPSMFVLQSGQIGTVLLLGVAGLLHGFAGRSAWAVGGGAFLLAVKPHLVYLLWPALGVWLLADRSRFAWLSAAWFVGLLIGAMLVAAAVNPSVLGQYLEAMRDRPPEHFRSPTIGSWLREGFGLGAFWLQFVPMACGAAWLMWWAITKRGAGIASGTGLLTLLLVSFVTAPYGAWPFDLVMLLPAVVTLAVSIPRLSPARQWVLIAGYAAWTVVAVVLNRLSYTSEYFFWMAPGLLALWLVGGKRGEANGGS